MHSQSRLVFRPSWAANFVAQGRSLKMEETMQSNHPAIVRPPVSVVFAVLVVLSVLGSGVYVLCFMK
jgi:hypothetical protein